MNKRKIYTWLSLILMASFVLCLGAACNNGSPADTTATPSANTTASGQAVPQTTPGGESASPSQGTPDSQATAAPQEEPVSSQDNVVTFPPSWFESTSGADGNEATATKQPQQSQQTANSATVTPVATPKPTQAGGDNDATAPNPTPTETATPKPEKTPIGTDEEGWIDIWV